MSHDHDDFAVEPIKGLPETLPDGEEILWQGGPSPWALAWSALSLPWVAGYFAFLTLWRFLTHVDIGGPAQAFAVASPFLFLGLIVCAILLLIAWIQSRSAVYTITNKRVAMRIGAALTITFNLPYTQIANASLDLRRNGTGTIALELIGRNRVSYILCWPHIRPWHIRIAQPALRCIPNAAHVAKILADAADARVSIPDIGRKQTDLADAAPLPAE